MAYLVDQSVVDATFQALDVREKNGYERHEVMLHLHDPEHSEDGLVYIAPVDNHAFLGPAPLQDMVAQILQCEGPSGRNIDYLFELATALRQLDADDPHVFDLEDAVREALA